MRRAAAKANDLIRAKDIHIVNDPSSGSKPVTLPFTGRLNGKLSPNVCVMGLPAAVEGSTALNDVTPHPPALPYQTPPLNQGTIVECASTVRINGRAAARDGDKAQTCDDASPAPHGLVEAHSSVMMG